MDLKTDKISYMVPTVTLKPICVCTITYSQKTAKVDLPDT